MQILNDSVQTAFDTMSTASVRYPAHQFLISWLRRISGASDFGTVGTSTVNNCLVRGENSIVTPTDLFDFNDETSKVIRLEYERNLEEPMGGLSFAMMNVVLDNTDKHFTPEFDSTIGTALLPNRPLKMAIGFNLITGKKMINTFKGLSDMVKENKMDRTVEFGGFDYLYYLRDLQMSSVLYSNLRSDEIIEKILIEAGFGTSQYVLDQGLNTIEFAWFNKEQTAGERIRQLCESEEGHFFQDEEGILRFQNRRHYIVSPFYEIQKYIHSGDILEWQVVDDVGIYNSVSVKANPREVYTNSIEVWKNGIVEQVDSKAEIEIWASMENPIYHFEDPVATTDFVANSASDGSGTNLTSLVSVAIDPFGDTAKLTITSIANQRIYMTYLRLRGNPAIITSEISQKYEDNVSISKYGKKVLEVNNDFIDSDSFAYYLARTLVSKYKNPLKRVRILVRGMPQLQLKDKISVYDQDLGTYKEYRIMRIQGVYSLGEFLQYLTIREITDGEVDSWAVVGTAIVDNTQEIVGF